MNEDVIFVIKWVKSPTYYFFDVKRLRNKCFVKVTILMSVQNLLPKVP